MAGVQNREALGLIPWVVSSGLLSVGAAVLLWLARRGGRPFRALLRFLDGKGWPFTPGEALTALYALGLPYAALVTGFLDPAGMGLTGFSWWPTLGRGALWGAFFAFLTGVVWEVYLRTGTPPDGLLERSQRFMKAPAGWPFFLVWAAAEEFHWAFYRALAMLVWGPETGLWAGLLLLGAERYIAPQTTARLRQPGGVEEEAWWLARLLVRTTAFAFLRNLWLCIALHALLEGLVAAWVRRRVAAPAPAGPGKPLSTAANPGHASAPTIALSAAVALALLTLFTWQAARPRLAPPGSAAPTVQPTPWSVPTPTPTATPFPTPPTTAIPTATPPPTLSPTLTPTPVRTYIVREGDTLNAIADAFDVSVADLMQANGITDPRALQIGQVLIIP